MWQLSSAKRTGWVNWQPISNQFQLGRTKMNELNLGAADAFEMQTQKKTLGKQRLKR